MRIAIFDYKTTQNNPTGSCHLRMLRELCEEHEFTVFSVEFENPNSRRIHWVKVPIPARPLALLFVGFHIVAPICYWAYRLSGRGRAFDLVQTVESNVCFGDIVYSHFCHRAYLSRHWRLTRSSWNLRSWLGWLDHKLHSILEVPVYKRVALIVAPSSGLARELRAEYPFTDSKIRLLANPVEIDRMQKSAGFECSAFRRDHGLAPDDIVLVFSALGHFERKGLPLLLEALRMAPQPGVKVAVVGGNSDLIDVYRARARKLGLGNRVLFTGMQRDVRPWLWTSDALIFPTEYEVFSLALLEAAAAGLPLIVTAVNGAEEFVVDGENGILIERTPRGIADGITRFLRLSPEARKNMGECARRDVRRYSVENFVAGWRALYEAEHVA